MTLFAKHWKLFSTILLKKLQERKLYKELGFESLKLRRTLGRLCTFYKIKTTDLPIYLYKLIPNTSHPYQTRRR